SRALVNARLASVRRVRSWAPGGNRLGLPPTVLLDGGWLEAEGLFEHLLRLRADCGRGRLAVLEEQDGRNRGNAVAHRESLFLVDVHLDERELVRALGCDPVEDGRDGVARATPLGPEVDDHRLVARDDLLLEGRL